MIRELDRFPSEPLPPARRPKADLRQLAKSFRLPLFAVFCFVLSLLGTFRNFGFDLAGLDGVRGLYPYVADGWGIWYWFARLGLSFNVYYLIVNLAFTACIFMLAFPKGKDYPKTVSFTLLLYVVFWFVFGQARYGMAAVLLALAIPLGSTFWLFALGLIAVLIHKAALGGVLLVALWLFLRRRKRGLAWALLFSVVISVIMLYGANNILTLIGYANYENLEALPAALTPVKYYYLIAILLLWKCFNWKAPDDLLILILIFLPFSYFIVFAGRSYEIFAVVFLTLMLTTKMPASVRLSMLALFVADVGLLFFHSGFFI